LSGVGSTTPAKGPGPWATALPFTSPSAALAARTSATFAAHAADYDLRTEWDGEPFDPAALRPGEPLELYGTELNGGQIPEIDAFCMRARPAVSPLVGRLPRRLPSRDRPVRWQRAHARLHGERGRICPLSRRRGSRSFTRLRDLKREIGPRRADHPAFVSAEETMP
jgi:hypothetical protein